MIARVIDSNVRVRDGVPHWFELLVEAGGQRYAACAIRCYSGYVDVCFIARVAGDWTPTANTYRGKCGYADPHGRQPTMRKGPRRAAIERTIRTMAYAAIEEASS